MRPVFIVVPHEVCKTRKRPSSKLFFVSSKEPFYFAIGLGSIDSSKTMFYAERIKHLATYSCDTIYAMDIERLKIALGKSEFDYSTGNRVNFPKLNREFARKYSRWAVKIRFVP